MTRWQRIVAYTTLVLTVFAFLYAPYYSTRQHKAGYGYQYIGHYGVFSEARWSKAINSYLHWTQIGIVLVVGSGLYFISGKPRRKKLEKNHATPE